MLRRFLLLLFFVTITSSTLFAQPGSVDSLYGFDDFSFPGAQLAPRNHLTIKASFSGQHLVVQVDIAAAWHLYSVTQPEGGTLPTTFEFTANEQPLTPNEIRPTTAPHVEENSVFGVPIESYDNQVTWLIRFDKELPHDQPINGVLVGQVCNTGEGGTCVRISEEFTAEFDASLNIETLLAETENIPTIFFHRKSATVSSVPVSSGPSPVTVIEAVPVTSLTWALIFAFFGGLILNLTPCVLPVIGLKVLSFFEQAGKSRLRAFGLNVAYSAGLMTVFMVLAFCNVGMSKLFTFELFGIIMSVIVFAMALSLMGVWEISIPAFVGGKTSMSLMKQEGGVGAYFKGIITTLLAIPCGGPMVSWAMSYADMQIRDGNTMQVFLLYGVVALGMASPYLFVGAFPELLRFFPKPGEWMETFKKTMGYFLLIAVVWILYFMPLEKMLPTIAVLFAVWFACWLIGRLEYTATQNQRLFSWLISLIVLGIVTVFSYSIPGLSHPYTLQNAMQTRLDYVIEQKAIQMMLESDTDILAQWERDGKHWGPYSDKLFAKALADGRPVIVDFTADWCMNCKGLEETVLNTNTIQSVLKEKRIVSFRADMGREGEALTFMRTLGPDQPPVLAIYDPKSPQTPIVLRGVYTQKTLLGHLEKLQAPSVSAGKSWDQFPSHILRACYVKYVKKNPCSPYGVCLVFARLRSSENDGAFESAGSDGLSRRQRNRTYPFFDQLRSLRTAGISDRQRRLRNENGYPSGVRSMVSMVSVRLFRRSAFARKSHRRKIL